MDTSLTDAIGKAGKARILVIGDVMVDRYFYGNVDRISPEAPIPILALKKEDYTLGGAGNVLANLAALGVKATLAGVCGDDVTAAVLRRLLDEMGVGANGLITDPDRPTTQKTRLIAGHQQLLRADQEQTNPLAKPLADQLLAQIETMLPGQDLVIVSDYGKGVLTDSLLSGIMALAAKQNKPVIVDPKGRNYRRYRGASLITPNRKELSEATHGQPVTTDTEVLAAAKEIIETCDISSLLVTRSQDGMSLIERSDDQPELKVNHLPTLAREVYDVSGAGDTVVATLAAALAVGVDLVGAARLANVAAGIVVGKIGTATVSPQELIDALRAEDASAAMHDDGAQSASGHVSGKQAREQIARWQRQGLKVGLTNGCFDILHAGHVMYLNQAKARCDRLVLALNHDASVRLLKGPTRPVNNEDSRAQVMAALRAVDMVVLFGATQAGEDNTASGIIANLKPDIYFKGGDYTIETLPEAKIIMGYGGRVEILSLLEGHSTTSIIARAGQNAA